MRHRISDRLVISDDPMPDPAGIPEGKFFLNGQAHLMGNRRVAGGDLFAFTVPEHRGLKGVIGKLTRNNWHVLLYHLPTNTWAYGGEYTGSQDIPDKEVPGGYSYHFFKPCNAAERKNGNLILERERQGGNLQSFCGNSRFNLALKTRESNALIDAYLEGRADQAARMHPTRPSAGAGQAKAAAEAEQKPLDVGGILPQTFLTQEFLNELSTYSNHLHVITDPDNTGVTSDRVIRLKNPEKISYEELDALKKFFRMQAMRFHPDSNRDQPDTAAYNQIFNQIGGLLKQITTEMRRKAKP